MRLFGFLLPNWNCLLQGTCNRVWHSPTCHTLFQVHQFHFNHHSEAHHLAWYLAEHLGQVELWEWHDPICGCSLAALEESMLGYGHVAPSRSKCPGSQTNNWLWLDDLRRQPHHWMGQQWQHSSNSATNTANVPTIANVPLDAWLLVVAEKEGPTMFNRMFMHKLHQHNWIIPTCSTDRNIADGGDINQHWWGLRRLRNW